MVVLSGLILLEVSQTPRRHPEGLVVLGHRPRPLKSVRANWPPTVWFERTVSSADPCLRRLVDGISDTP